MKRKKIFSILVVLLMVSVAILVFARKHRVQNDERFVEYIVDPKKQSLQLYWKDDKNERFGSIQNLKSWFEKNKKNLVFAMNGGMYKPGGAPQGLYIEKGTLLSPLDTSTGSGNFYLKPNGVFYLFSDNSPVICKTSDFVNNGQIKYATQSGPMLVIDGEIHPAFTPGSKNLNIRNGVGITQDNKVVFAMSKKEISFYNFAAYFKNIGCRNALYLDGLVSRTYLPLKNWSQLDGGFGVIIAVTTSKE
jgi:uncharacterized protein YigE (DUF2233 family)